MASSSYALSLFDSSDFPASDEGPSRLVALGKNALSASGEQTGSSNPGSQTQEAVIGTLVWYSVSDAVRLTPEVLREAMEAASLDTATLTPRAPTPEAALTRAAEAAQVRSRRLNTDRNGEAVEDERYANILIRPADHGVKQMVTEVLDCSENRLLYQPTATLYLEEGDLQVEPIDHGKALDVETDALSNLRAYFTFEKERHDGEGARRVIGRALAAANAIPLRNSGGMYFVPKKPDEESADGPGAHEGTARNLLSFVAQVKNRAGSAPTKTPRPSQAMSVPLVDREEYREIVAESLDEHVEKEAKALIREMSRLLKSEQAVTARRGRGFVERVKALKEGVAQYEELLEMRATEARTHLDTALKQARGLLGRVEGPDEREEDGSS